jgi:tetratricopeptide (TPR) repeat protein
MMEDGSSSICIAREKVLMMRQVSFLLVSAAMLLAFNSAFVEAKNKKPSAVKPQAVPASFKQAVQEFGQQHYGPAAALFEKADQGGYCNDQSHYYLALCYHNLNQTQRAMQHYSWVASYSKNPNMRYQAQVGYAQVAQYASHRTYTGAGPSSGFSAFSGGGGGG